MKEKKVKENYDVIVVGAGPAGIMTCYELYLKNPELEVLLIDKGHDVMNRHQKRLLYLFHHNIQLLQRIIHHKLQICPLQP